MKKVILLAGVLAILAACATSSTKDNDPWNKLDPSKVGGSSSVLNLSMHSNSMGREMTYSIWLPAGYDESKTYPFFYLLHGYETDDQNGQFNRCWLDKGNAAYIADDYQKSGGVPMVIVMPNGLNKFYIADGYEQYFEEELMAEVEKKYHCNGKRAIGGLSMGGYGTLYHALTYPQKFTYAYAMSPAVDNSWTTKVKDASLLPGITIETGEDDMTTRLNTITPFVNAMKNKGVEIDFITRLGGHEWPFWQVCLPKALRKAANSF